MKRLSLFLFLLFCTVCPAVCEERSEVLKVYDWPEAVTDEVIAGFPEFYKRYTGKNIRVQYQTFDSDIATLNQIVASHDDWDVLTLSNMYLVKYIQNGTLIPIDRSYLKKYNAPDYIGNLSPFLREKLNECSTEFKVADYFAPFTLNSCGFVFDSDIYSRSDFSSWNALRDPKYKGQILFISDPTDLYYVALADIYHEELLAGKLTLKDLYWEYNDSYPDKIREWGKEANPQISGWDTGFGCDYMVHGKVPVKVSWLTDANYIIELSKEEGGPALDFVIPDEGGYLCSDGQVIPRYCGNPEAAVFWINYLQKSDVVISNLGLELSNMVVADTIVLEAIQDRERYPNPVDLSYLFPDCPEKASEVYVNDALYIDAKNIDKFSFCGDISNNIDNLLLLLAEIQSQKTSLVEFWPEAIICVVLLAMLIAKLMKKK